MYKQCQSERSAQRQHELEQGLLSLLLVRNYEDISVTDICDRMQIPRKSFYRYFSGKDGALMALIDHTLMHYESFNAQSTSDGRSVQRELETFFRFWQAQKPLMDAMERNNLSAMLVHRCVDNATSNNALPTRLMGHDAPENRATLATFAICGLMSLVIRWHHNGYRQSVEYMAATAVRLLCQPLFPDVDQLL